MTAVISGTALLLLAALPVLTMRLAISDEGNNPAGSTTRVAYDRLAEGFGPGVNGPLVVVVENPGNVSAIVAQVEAIDGIAFVADAADEQRWRDQRVHRLSDDRTAVDRDRAAGT